MWYISDSLWNWNYYPASDSIHGSLPWPEAHHPPSPSVSLQSEAADSCQAVPGNSPQSSYLQSSDGPSESKGTHWDSLRPHRPVPGSEQSEASGLLHPLLSPTGQQSDLFLPSDNLWNPADRSDTPQLPAPYQLKEWSPTDWSGTPPNLPLCCHWHSTYPGCHHRRYCIPPNNRHDSAHHCLQAIPISSAAPHPAQIPLTYQISLLYQQPDSPPPVLWDKCPVPEHSFEEFLSTESFVVIIRESE